MGQVISSKLSQQIFTHQQLSCSAWKTWTGASAAGAGSLTRQSKCPQIMGTTIGRGIPTSTVDGNQNSGKLTSWGWQFIPWFTRFYSSQVVQDVIWGVGCKGVYIKDCIDLFVECCKQDPKAWTSFFGTNDSMTCGFSMEHIPKFRDIASHLWLFWQVLPVSSQQKATCCWGETPVFSPTPPAFIRSWLMDETMKPHGFFLGGGISSVTSCHRFLPVGIQGLGMDLQVTWETCRSSFPWGHV